MQCATKTVKLHKDIAKDMQSNDGHLNMSFSVYTRHLILAKEGLNV
jgi:hypothetical protein